MDVAFGEGGCRKSNFFLLRTFSMVPYLICKLLGFFPHFPSIKIIIVLKSLQHHIHRLRKNKFLLVLTWGEISPDQLIGYNFKALNVVLDFMAP